MPPNNSQLKNWEDTFFKKVGGLYCDGNCELFHCKRVIDVVREVVHQAELEVWETERKFILNVLDGIDQADKEMGNESGGTKAIRFALQSRVFSSLKDQLSKEEKCCENYNGDKDLTNSCIFCKKYLGDQLTNKNI